MNQQKFDDGRIIFVLDTNIPLDDPNCLTKYGKNCVEIHINVIEELDKHKRGIETINYNARQFINIIDNITKDKVFNGGVSIGEGLGTLRIALATEMHKFVKKNLTENSVDNNIINHAYCLKLKEENKDYDVVILSKDMNLCLKAKALGILALDLSEENLVSTDLLVQGLRTEEMTSEIVNNIFQKEVECTIDGLTENQNLILKCEGKDVTYVKHQDKMLKLVKPGISAFGLKNMNPEQMISMDALLDPTISLVAIEGVAGTGKTIMSLACALEQIKKAKYTKMFFSREIVAFGREIGYLKGNVDDKIAPFMMCMHDNLDELANNKDKNHKEKIDEYLKNHIISTQVIGFIQGRSLPSVIYIVDEAQNLSPSEVKEIITRAGKGTKMIFLGDTTQIANEYLSQKSNGFTYLINRFQNQRIFSYVHLTKTVRSELAELAAKLM